MSTLPYATTQNDLTRELMGLERTLLGRFTDLETFETFLLEEQKGWDEPVIVKRVIALPDVKANVGLTSEAVDGFVRVELADGSQENWRLYYLKEGSFSTPPFEDFWLEPVGIKYA